MIKVIVHGYKGRLGSGLIKLIDESDKFEMAGAVDANAENTIQSDSEAMGGIPVFSNMDQCNIKADVLIDFSFHTAAPKLADYGRRTGTPLVIATTALTDDERNSLEEAAKKIPVLLAPNMSLGVNLMAELIKQAAAVLGEDFDVDISERHQAKKKDAPSGTAIFLAEHVAHGKGAASDKVKEEASKIPMHSARAGNIPGEHTVLFAGTDELIEIKHTALSPMIFARGALKAAEYLVTCEAGMYSMADVL